MLEFCPIVEDEHQIFNQCFANGKLEEVFGMLNQNPIQSQSQFKTKQRLGLPATTNRLTFADTASFFWGENSKGLLDETFLSTIKEEVK